MSVLRKLLLYSLFPVSSTVCAETVEPLPYGDFEQWAVRFIHESRLIGGKTKLLYVPSKTDTIRVNSPYRYGSAGSPWCTSNAYAHVAGIHKASVSTTPERRDAGYCCRLDCKLESVVALGIDLKVVAAGTCYLGGANEPVGMAQTKDPYSALDMGIPFDKTPAYVMLDYKAFIEPSNKVTYAKATAYPKTREGKDCAEVYAFLQRRWEDANGRIHAVRIATAYHRIHTTVSTWQNDHRIPFRYGDISGRTDFQPWEGLTTRFKANNSRGKSVTIEEEGWGTGQPTHLILMMTSSSYEAFIGHVGNTLWVDNIRLVYND